MNESLSEHWQTELSLLGAGVSEAVQWAGLVVEHAEGSHIIDTDGTRYLDFMGGAGVNLLGHSDPDYLAALTRQMNSWMIGAHASAARLDALRGLDALLPRSLERIQFYSGGAEAVESAVRLAKSATGKFEVLSFWRGFHGRTAAALAVTGAARTGYGPAMPGTHAAPYAYCYRCPLKTTFPTCGFGCVELARDVLREQSSGALAAVIVEPLQGRAGNVVPPPGYLTAVQELAAEHDALLILDESMTGLGRTGTVLAGEHDAVVGDIVVLGKGLGNGYPVSAVAASTTLMSTGPFANPSASSSSYGGFPLACAAVAAVTTAITHKQLAALARVNGTALLERLKASIPETGIVGDIRGRGLAIGIELVTDTHDRTPLGKQRLRSIFTDLLDAGLLVMVGGNSLRLYPPLTANSDELDHASDILTEVLARHNHATV